MGISDFLSSRLPRKNRHADRSSDDAAESDARSAPQEERNGPAPTKKRRHGETSPEEALGFRVESGRPDGKPERRRSFRVRYPGLVCRIAELQKVFRVRDVSATGLGIEVKGKRIKAGARLHLVLGAEGKALIKGLVLRVVRHDEGLLGGEFEELDRAQEDRLNQLVLDAQKHQAELRHKRSV